MSKLLTKRKTAIKLQKWTVAACLLGMITCIIYLVFGVVPYRLVGVSVKNAFALAISVVEVMIAFFSALFACFSGKQMPKGAWAQFKQVFPVMGLIIAYAVIIGICIHKAIRGFADLKTATLKNVEDDKRKRVLLNSLGSLNKSILSVFVFFCISSFLSGMSVSTGRLWLYILLIVICGTCNFLALFSTKGKWKESVLICISRMVFLCAIPLFVLKFSSINFLQFKKFFRFVFVVLELWIFIILTKNYITVTRTEEFIKRKYLPQIRIKAPVILFSIIGGLFVIMYALAKNASVSLGWRSFLPFVEIASIFIMKRLAVGNGTLILAEAVFEDSEKVESNAQGNQGDTEIAGQASVVDESAVTVENQATQGLSDDVNGTEKENSSVEEKTK